MIAFPTVVVVDPPLLLRALEVYEVNRIDFAEAYLVACAEATGVETIASFDRAIDRVTTVRRNGWFAQRQVPPMFLPRTASH